MLKQLNNQIETYRMPEIIILNSYKADVHMCSVSTSQITQSVSVINTNRLILNRDIFGTTHTHTHTRCGVP